MIDTHCHIYLDHFIDDLDEVLKRAVDAGVERILMPAINFHSVQQMDRLRHKHLRFYKMAGIHPTEINENEISDEELYEYCNRPDVYAVGETGLDYYWSTDYQKEQQTGLRLHCKVSKTLDKPIVLHNRESTADLLNIIESEQDGSLKGVWHCFNGTVSEGRRAIDLGLLLGIGGVLTFKNAGVDAIVAQLPLEKMILETDAPYLAPEPRRGKRNEPAFIKYTANKLAEVFGLSLSEIKNETNSNAILLFSLESL